MRVARRLIILIAVVSFAVLAPTAAGAQTRPAEVATAGDVAVLRQAPPQPDASSLAADYMLMIAGVGAWATLSIWVATRHRRRVWAAFGRAAAAVGDEAERWLRDQ